MKTVFAGYRKPRTIRILLASAVLIGFLGIFLANGEIAGAIANVLLFLQFAPSVVGFVQDAALPAMYGFGVVLLLTVILGRVYCSVLCPLGIFQDIVLFFKRLFVRRKSRYGNYRKSSVVLRYFILAAVVSSFIFGTVGLVNLLDPYSIFGRMTLLFFEPAAIFGKNTAVNILNRYDIHWLWPERFLPVFWNVFWITLAFMVGIIGLTLWRGRYYCNTICPVGTILGLVNRLSLFKVQIKPEAFIACGRCQVFCRAECIDIAGKTIDSSRCVNCFDCVAVCPTSAAVYGRTCRNEAALPVDVSRRGLLAGAAVSGGVLAFLPTPLKLSAGGISETDTSLIMPPGTVSRERFCATCIGCGLCVSVCPEKAIRQTFLDYGLRGLLAPRMDYQQGYCAYECNLCGQRCPSGAIRNLPLAEKQHVQMGKVRLHKGRCVVHSQDIDCGACAEACPTHAVYTVKRNNVHYPQTNTDLCTGCGACENICPMSPKAITVEGSVEQGTLSKPAAGPSQKPSTTGETTQEFPF